MAGALPRTMIQIDVEAPRSGIQSSGMLVVVNRYGHHRKTAEARCRLITEPSSLAKLASRARNAPVRVVSDGAVKEWWRQSRSERHQTKPSNLSGTGTKAYIGATVNPRLGRGGNVSDNISASCCTAKGKHDLGYRQYPLRDTGTATRHCVVPSFGKAYLLCVSKDKGRVFSHFSHYAQTILFERKLL